jgi:hypothetical protein
MKKQMTEEEIAIHMIANIPLMKWKIISATIAGNCSIGLTININYYEN